jgi:hypothetical protein
MRAGPRLLSEYRRLEKVMSMNRRRFLHHSARAAAASAAIFLGATDGVGTRRSTAVFDPLDQRTLLAGAGPRGG